MVFFLLVAVDDTIDILVSFIQLVVDEPLGVSLRRVFVDRTGVFDVVFLDVLSRCNERRRQRSGEEEGRWILWVPDADVAVCVEHFVVVEDVIPRDKCTEQFVRRRGGGLEEFCSRV
jgi:hypothetical protein